LILISSSHRWNGDGLENRNQQHLRKMHETQEVKTMKINKSTGLVGAVCTGVLALGTLSANAVLLSYMPFDGGAIGQSLADTTAMGPGAIGFTSTFTAITSPANSQYVTGLSGSQGGSGNAFAAGFGGSHRNRMIIDRTTPAYVSSGILEGAQDLLGADGTSVYGSVLISNPNGAPAGFTGLEFAIGDPNANRKITIGEANGGVDWVVIGGGQAGATASPINLALPPAGAFTRQIVFRIDFGAGNADTFTLINPDGTDGVTSAATDLSFSTLHLASFSGAPAVVYDEIKLGTTLADVYAVPEPSSFALLGLGGLALLFRRRKG